MELADHYQTNRAFRDPVRRELESLGMMLDEALRSRIPIIDEICSYLKSTPGKRLRPNILFLASKSAGGSPEAPLTAGMAVELIHTATLIHDDIIDNHQIRRGKSTVYSKWGSNIATVMGDFLYSKAFSSLGEAGLFEIMKVLSQTTHLMSAGEMMQFEQTRNLKISEARYMEMIYSKTASLFSASSECGAMIGGNGNGSSLRKNYSHFGENIGLAFQITDDLIDYIAADSSIGKPVASDFTEGRVTLPFIRAFRNAPAGKKKRVSELFRVGFDKDEEWGEVVSFVQNYGGVEYSLNKARELGEKAKDSLKVVSPSLERDALCYAADYIVERVSPFSS